MKKTLIWLLAVLALSSGLLVQRWMSMPQKAPVNVDLSVAYPDLNGISHRIDEWPGKVLVVNFWATWCPPCLEEMPEFVKIQNELGTKGLQFLGVAIDDPASVAEFLKSTPVNYPILIGETGAEAWAASLGNHMNVLPFSVILDHTGKLIHSKAGPLKRDELLEIIGPKLE
jgi:thiol-disulfide isomerase/thioredoxin